MTGAQVDRRRRIFVGIITSAAVLAITHHPADYVPPTSPIAEVGHVGPHPAGLTPAADPGCFEDEAAVVAYDPDPAHGLTWVCVALDDFADDGSLARLEELGR